MVNRTFTKKFILLTAGIVILVVLSEYHSAIRQALKIEYLDADSLIVLWSFSAIATITTIATLISIKLTRQYYGSAKKLLLLNSTLLGIGSLPSVAWVLTKDIIFFLLAIIFIPIIGLVVIAANIIRVVSIKKQNFESQKPPGYSP